MNIFRIVQQVKDFVDDQIAYEEGQEDGEYWVENGGGPVNDGLLQRIHMGGEQKSWPSYNRGFISQAGYVESED